MQHYRPYIESLVARGGPVEADIPEFETFVGELAGAVARGDLPTEKLSAVRAAFGDALSLGTLQGRTFRKPNGGPVDYEMLDAIYGGYVSPEPRFANWDRYYQRQATACAMRRRKAYFQKLLDLHHARRPGLRVLKISSGPGRAMAEWFAKHPDADTRFHCIEPDSRAISHATALNEKFLDRVTFHHDEPLLFHGPDREYDLIWAVGLFDHLGDALCVRMLRRLFPALALGGELVVGNFSDANPGRAYMELVGDWRAYHRTRTQLYTLAAQATLPYAHIAVTEEPEGVNLFLHLGR
jgi:extracellular factor (EF) 3-hydroxypalmitic acid methyl ester biosynthesis protein